MEPISFVTIFLSLMVGVHPVELAVGDDVASVEIVLDGEQIAEVHGPPWTVAVDLGDELEPHRLVARAFDRQGEFIGRAEQFVNIRRGSFESGRTPVIVFDRKGEISAEPNHTPCLTASGQPARVVAVDEPRFDVYVVFDEGARFAWFASRKQSGTSGRIQSTIIDSVGGNTTLKRISGACPEKDGQRTRFGASPIGRPVDGRMISGLHDLRTVGGLDSGQAVADAVARAGYLAKSGGRRSAVVLVVSDDVADCSQFSPAVVRSYLRSLGIPLLVWSPETKRFESPWGRVAQTSNVRRINGALEELRRHVEHQRVVWIEGVHLPQDVALGSGCRGISLHRGDHG
jgi:hypothetical protein